MRTGLHVQKQVIAAPVVHFGLGTRTSIEVARIVWPNGVLQSEFDRRSTTRSWRAAAQGIVSVAVRVERHGMGS